MSPHPLVDQNAKNELIVKKQIRQSTSKILQRPSQFDGYDNRQKQLETNVKIKEKLEKVIGNGNYKPSTPSRRKRPGSETGFDQTFQSNFKEEKRLTEYEEQFEALHKEIEYEAIEKKNIKSKPLKKFGPVSIGNLASNYPEPKQGSKLFSQSSNSARDNLAGNKIQNDFVLGREPDVPTGHNMRLISRLTNTIDRKLRQMTPALPDLELVKPKNDNPKTIEAKPPLKVPARTRKCPDPTLYEDVLEVKHLGGRELPNLNRSSKNCSPEKEKDPHIRTPFENLQRRLFSLFTTLVPWSCMKRVYWKRDRKSEALYERTTRMNAKSRKLRTEHV